MDIKIYQLDLDNEKAKAAAFMPVMGSPDSALYDRVFHGEVPCKNLEEVYEMFNINHPAKYRGRSLSVSDIVVMDNAAFAVDPFGFRKLTFEPSKPKLKTRRCSTVKELIAIYKELRDNYAVDAEFSSAIIYHGEGEKHTFNEDILMAYGYASELSYHRIKENEARIIYPVRVLVDDIDRHSLPAVAEPFFEGPFTATLISRSVRYNPAI